MSLNSKPSCARRPTAIPLAIFACAALTGCVSTAGLLPDGQKIAAVWHGQLPHGGKTTNLLNWWSGFRDPALTQLLALSERKNTSLAIAIANIDAARATVQSGASGLLPSATGTASVLRSGTNAKTSQRVPASTTSSGALDAGWELDLFGKTRNTVLAADAKVTARIADWHDARVSLAAEVADDYVQYRACRQLEAIYRDELNSEQQTIKATELSAVSGLKSTADLALVRASAASSASSLTAQVAECEVLIKSLTELAGGDELQVRAILKTGRRGIPVPQRFTVKTVPADLLRQRPDVYSLEKQLAATAFSVGASEADLYPSLSLSGSLTLNQNSLTGTNLPWSFGPSLSLPLFDGGQRRAAVKLAKADYDLAAANYRAGILSAVKEVETALVHLDSAHRQLSDAATAAREYKTYFKSVDENWKAGGASVLDREEARRSAQSAEITLVGLRRDTVEYWIALYKAIGGGWSADTAPNFREGKTE
jgi:NodT family efflux transporter outer membrane factor (OMF) lipoprotein